MTPIKNINRYINEYNDRFLAVKINEQSISPLKKTTTEAKKIGKGELYVLVIGESQNRDFMGIYNNLFDTNPFLEKYLKQNNSVIFTNAYSCFTHTVPVIAYALSNKLISEIKSAEYKDIIQSNYVPLSSILRGANIQSYWLSNQSESGLWDSGVSTIANSFDIATFTTQSEFERPKYDEVLLPELKKTLNNINPNENNVIVLHLMGNHNTYKHRYPHNFAKFKIERSGIIGNITDKKHEVKHFNEYLNSCLYNDYILDKIINLINKRNDFMGLLYLSDHADVPKYGHNFSLFKHSMTHIPMFFTFSKRFEQRYPNKIENLRENSSTVFINDRLYDLMLDLMDIQNDAYRPNLSPANGSFKPLTYEQGYIFNKINVFDDPDLQVKNNWQKLASYNVALHRCNSQMKFQFAHSLGIDRVELDLNYDEKVGLCLNHDKCKDDDLTLNEFLEQNRNSLKRLWLDIKNLDTENAESIFTILSELDRKYLLKNIALVETRYPETLPEFINAGWETSYYLPWSELLNQQSSKQTEQEILNNIKKYQIRGISYDAKAYEFISRKINSREWPKLTQYTWDLDINLGDRNAMESIKKYQQVEILLLPLKTYFDY